MSVALNTDRTVISRLRVRGGASDPMLTRLRISTVLSSAALAPPDISPAAILIVRSLKDPLPGKLALHGGAIRLSSEWEQAVRSQMAALTRRALRPIRDAVSETAEAVLFADHGELLACLARDWLQGAVGRWWWQTLFPDRDLAAAVARAWFERADCIPAAMAHLASTGHEVAFVSRLRIELVRALLQSVLEVHGLPNLRSALAPLVQPAFVAQATEPADRSAADRPLQSEPRVQAPWRSPMPGGLPSVLNGVQEAFVGVCLALIRLPHRVRSRDFSDRAKRWTESQVNAVRAPRVEVAPAQKIGSATLSGFRADLPRPHEGKTELEQDRSAMPARQTRGAVGPRSAGPRMMEQVVSLGDAIDEGSEPLASSATQPALEARPDRMAGELDEQRIDTQFGGVFLLINLALFLELYGDFANPGRPGIELSIWDFIALVAENLLGPELRDEPVWSLLARLAGRNDGEEPARGLPGRRLLKRRLPSLRSRLRRALGVATDREVGSLLLRRAARVCVTPTRLDVSFALAELPIEVRLSGLDRDPGWVPAAGRTIRFHFD